MNQMRQDLADLKAAIDIAVKRAKVRAVITFLISVFGSFGMIPYPPVVPDAGTVESPGPATADEMDAWADWVGGTSFPWPAGSG